jgi:anti-sigma factor RsiW
VSNHSSLCPEFSLLSQFVDRELGDEEGADVARHLESCPRCRTRVARLAQTEKLLQTTLPKSSARLAEWTPTRECLSPEVLSAYVHRLLPARDESTVEKHLQACDVCLDEVMQASAMTVALASARKEPVPGVLQGRVASLWESPAAEQEPGLLARLVVRVAKKGLQLVEQHLVPPFFDVQEILMPVPAYRAGEIPGALDLQLRAGQLEIHVTASPEGQGVSLKLVLSGAGGEALAGQRVFLRQGGRSIFSAKTDGVGVLQTPHLEPGAYEIACAGMDVAFQLELRAGE